MKKLEQQKCEMKKLEQQKCEALDRMEIAWGGEDRETSLKRMGRRGYYLSRHWSRGAIQPDVSCLKRRPGKPCGSGEGVEEGVPGLVGRSSGMKAPAQVGAQGERGRRGKRPAREAGSNGVGNRSGWEIWGEEGLAGGVGGGGVWNRIPVA